MEAVKTVYGAPYLINLTKKVDPATAILKNENYFVIQEYGEIEDVVIQFPSGCNFLVEVNFGINERKIVDGLKLDGDTREVKINVKVNKGDFVWAEIYNYDSTYQHEISITSLFRPIIAEII